jgi:cellulose synthase (UDP-forming)
MELDTRRGTTTLGPPVGTAVRSVTPRLSETREKLIRAVAAIALAYATYWIFWRWTNTINPEPRAIVPSLLLLIAETWAYINMLMFVFIVWRLKERDPGPPPQGRAVDVFITCYDEPLDVLRRTAIGARAIRYPHRTYLLDDGKRDDVRAMCEELEVGYIRRVGNANAKAGNLNFALSVTSGEFILQLDADHVPLPGILDRMLGYFKDPKMAVVQSPQDFYNVDSFTHIVNDQGRRLWEENRIFYSLIQPGRDNWNASFFCGSCGIIRRSALDAIGGFASQTIIEDMETTIQFHAHGFNSAYHNETLAYGLAPGSAGAYHVQRLRWGQGAMQILRKLKPLTMKGLTLPQRICYFAGTACYLEGWQKAIFYLMPLFYFFTGILPVGGNEREFLFRLIPYIAIAIIAFELLSRGTGYLFLSERFTMVRVYTYMMAALALFTTKALKFNVTPKGKSGVPFRTYAPQLTLLILSIIAPIWATVAYHEHWVDYTAKGWGSMAFWVNGMWALWNCYFALYVVRHSLAMKQERDDHRFADQFSIELFPVGAETTAIPQRGVVVDLNPAGLGFRATQRFEPGTRLSFVLPLSTGEVHATGEVRHISDDRELPGSAFVHGVAFSALPIEARDAIELHCAHHSMPVWRLQFRQSIDILTRANEMMRNLRGERRRLVGLPASVHVTGSENGDAGELPGTFILDELSTHGARLISDAPLPPGTPISFDVEGTAIKGAGTVRYVRLLQTPAAALFVMGVSLLKKDAPAGRAANGGLARLREPEVTRV